MPRSCSAGWSGQEVAGELFHNETVVGKVVVEGLNDVVAIAPGVRIKVIFVHAGGVGVAGDVEPMTSPAFAIVRRGKQAVDDLGVGVWGMVGQEGADLLRRRG